jgi:hypothetical protein
MSVTVKKKKKKKKKPFTPEILPLCALAEPTNLHFRVRVPGKVAPIRNGKKTIIES